ncbi:MAG TPA: hypothetical protein VG323_06680, partial [Thermoanaerobaculia bacterium]|nr:hypothetical protein [Thermoanaerobaculia bacterium]
MTAALACGGALLVGAVVRRARRHASFAIGAAFSRIVVFASASDKIPADAKWVLIDQIRGSL